MFVLLLQLKEMALVQNLALQVFHVIDNNQLLLLRIGTDGRILERYVLFILLLVSNNRTSFRILRSTPVQAL